MKNTDFSGSYDYELEEAQQAAEDILDDLEHGYLSSEELPARIERERIHWKKSLPETWEEFDKYFLEFLKNANAI